MTSISALANRELFATPLPIRSNDGPAASAASSENKPSRIEHRVAQLQKHTLEFAQDFLGQFAQQLFGDAAKGMKVSFDQIELKANSEASMSLASSTNGTSSTQAARFSLNDSSSFSGKGTITTADGQKFEFELSVNYESRQEFTYAQQSKAATNLATSDAPNSKMLYQGPAEDILNNISADPVPLPFKLSDSDNQDQGSGNMILKLLNLKGGDRFFNWFGDENSKVDQKA